MSPPKYPAYLGCNIGAYVYFEPSLKKKTYLKKNILIKFVQA